MSLRIRKNIVPPPACPLTECMSLLRRVDAERDLVLERRSTAPQRDAMRHPERLGKSAQRAAARARGQGVIARRAMPTSIEYSLTDLGRELIPAINAIVGVRLKLTSNAADPALLSSRNCRLRRSTA